MDLAASLYLGGKLILATEANYSSSRELGLICPFCKESVFLVQGHTRKGTKVVAAWRHYKYSHQSNYCERRAISKEGKEALNQFKPKAQNQRLKLFNKRFWEIYSLKKAIPKNLKKHLLQSASEAELEKMALHCWERWEPEKIKAMIPAKIKFQLGDNKKAEEYLRNHPAFKRTIPAIRDDVISDFINIQFSVLRLKILNEAIDWLGTKTAVPAFKKMIELALFDCLEILPLPIHSQSVQDMAITSLLLTDWEESIEAIKKKGGIGF